VDNLWKTSECLFPGQLFYLPAFLTKEEAEVVFLRLSGETEWEQHYVTIFGKTHPCPRLSSWHGIPQAVYSYSGHTFRPKPLSSLHQYLIEKLEAGTGFQFNSVLLNLYRNGADSMGWHSDDEPELGEDPTIASLSLGETRRFVLKEKSDRRESVEHHGIKDRSHPRKLDLVLGSGSLLLMAGACQQTFKHSVPKTSKPVGARINLTFRLILPE
jgi:alkylated DNA repair dioxygenase AlkB